MTPKQLLLAHIGELHRDQPRPADTYAELGRWHARQHHRYTPRNHYHAGVNSGPDNRPPGWLTGQDAVEQKP